MGSELVKPHHLGRRAVIYVRQSTPHQVLTNQESPRLQYALRQRARELGWREADIDVIDADLGLSGAAAAHRQGFKDLVARVTLGEVGLILSTEVTRLARNCSDWYPLLDVCGHRQCLIADRDGVYDAGCANGRLLLGLKAYAGAFVYGRVKREVEPGEPPSSIERRLPPAAWDIVVRDVYPAYLSFDAYLANRRQLRDNLAGFERESRGAARNGAALLHGLVVCGRCGSRMGVSYGRGDRHRRYECRRAQAEYAAPVCQSFLAREIDRTVAEAFLEAVRPAGLEATIAALHGLEAERRSVDRQWQLRLERARYEARLAQRQYDAVDPD